MAADTSVFLLICINLSVLHEGMHFGPDASLKQNIGDSTPESTCYSYVTVEAEENRSVRGRLVDVPLPRQVEFDDKPMQATVRKRYVNSPWIGETPKRNLLLTVQ